VRLSFEIFEAVTIHIMIFWLMRPRNLVGSM